MNTAKKISGIALAAAAAAMFTATANVSAASHGMSKAEGQCIGVNGCKGQSACATADSQCKGLNSCKGHGFLKMTKAECDDKGGKFEMPKM